jgi:phytoene dehydrogenase-like protein
MSTNVILTVLTILSVLIGYLGVLAIPLMQKYATYLEGKAKATNHDNRAKLIAHIESLAETVVKAWNQTVVNNAKINGVFDQSTQAQVFADAKAAIIQQLKAEGLDGTAQIAGLLTDRLTYIIQAKVADNKLNVAMVDNAVAPVVTDSATAQTPTV